MKSTRYFSNKQEKRVAERVGGKQVSNSGATAFNKGDVITDDWLIECKTCTNPKSSMTVKKEWLEKNKEEAFAMRRNFSAVAIDFGSNDTYYIIDEKTFLGLLKIVELFESKW